jgi:hypothetical protein
MPTPIPTRVVSPADIRDVVAREDDFGHEMRVGAVLKRKGARVLHGGTYTDPITKKPRQFDFRGKITFEDKCLLLTVECKNLNANQPLVVCGAARRDHEAFHDLIESRFGNWHRRTAFIEGQSSVTRRATLNNAFYVPGKFVGKSPIRIQVDKTPMTVVRSPESDVYDKWAQALSSAVGLAEQACGLAQAQSKAKLTVSILPAVIVPDGLLWTVMYDDNGNILEDPGKSDGCELYLGREIELGRKGTPLFHRFIFSHIHFMTLAGLDSFLARMIPEGEAWRGLFTELAVENEI